MADDCDGVRFMRRYAQVHFPVHHRVPMRLYELHMGKRGYGRLNLLRLRVERFKVRGHPSVYRGTYRGVRLGFFASITETYEAAKNVEITGGRRQRKPIVHETEV